MHLSINSQLLAQELKLLEKVVNQRAAIPILSNVLIKAKADVVEMSATDIDVGFTTQCSARIHASGVITLPVKKLMDLVNQIPDQDVTIKLEAKSRVRVTSGDFKSSLQTLDAADFPTMPKAVETQVSISTADLRTIIEKTHFATSDKSTRYFMNGAQMSFTEQIAAMVATDGRRLALATVTRQGAPLDAVVIPQKALEFLRTYESDALCDFSVDDRHLFFSYGKTRVFYTRMIDGKFPNYQAIMPRENHNTMTIGRQSLASALRRVSLVAEQNMSVVHFNFEPTQLRLTASSADVGDADEHVKGTLEGEPMKCGIPATFVLDFLDAAQSQTIEIKYKDHQTALRFHDGSDYFNVIMPMR